MTAGRTDTTLRLTLGLAAGLLVWLAYYDGRPLAWYDRCALAAPVLVKATTSGVCYCLGDVLSQLAQASPLDARRSARSAVAGFVGHGPLAHYWLGVVDTRLAFGGAWWSFFPRILLDQGPMSIVYNTVYTTLIGAQQCSSPRDIYADIRSTIYPSFVASVKFWPFVHILTFSHAIPQELKVLYVDMAEILWVVVLATINADKRGAGEGRGTLDHRPS